MAAKPVVCTLNTDLELPWEACCMSVNKSDFFYPVWLIHSARPCENQRASWWRRQNAYRDCVYRSKIGSSFMFIVMLQLGSLHPFLSWAKMTSVGFYCYLAPRFWSTLPKSCIHEHFYHLPKKTYLFFLDKFSALLTIIWTFCLFV